MKLNNCISKHVQNLESRIVPVCPYGPVFAANTSSPAGSPSVAMDNDGDYVVTWNRYVGVSEVYARRFNADNVPLGPEFQVNTETSGTQEYPDIAMNATGEFVIVWQSIDGSDLKIKGQRFNSVGAPQGGEFSIQSAMQFSGSHPKVAMDATGDFAVTWNGGSNGFAYSRLFESDGTPKGPEFPVVTNTEHRGEDPAIAMDADGDFVVVYQRTEGMVPNHTGYIWARVFDELGGPLGDEFNVNNATTGYGTGFPDVAMDSSGDFVVTWSLLGPAIQARQFNSAGVPTGSEFMVNELPLQAPRSHPSVTMDSDGNFIIVWTQGQTATASGGIIGQSFDPMGLRKGGQFIAFENSGNSPDVAIGVNQDFVVAWGGYPPGPTSTIGIGVQQFVGPPRIMSVDVNDGSVQRSLVKSVTLHFCEDVSFVGDMANAFQLERTGPNGTTGTVQVNAVQSGKDVVLTFGQGGAIGTDPGASLIDGNYQLTLVANSILGSSGLALDGNNDRQPGGNYVFSFHRQFGDVNGDRIVSASDFAVFRLHYGTTNPSTFDFDGDGSVSAADFGQFRARYGITLVP